jgi:hypothetical protein
VSTAPLVGSDISKTLETETKGLTEIYVNNYFVIGIPLQLSFNDLTYLKYKCNFYTRNGLCQ